MLIESPLERALFRWCALTYVVLGVAFLVWVRLSRGEPELWALGGLALTSFVAMGKLVVFAGLKAGAPSIWTIALLLFGIDLGCAFALAGGIEPLERLPRAGTSLARARRKAETALERYPGLRKLAFFGVVAFVFLPVAGTGAITGSIVARILGLKRLTGVAAIALASGVSTLGFALLARFAGVGAQSFLRNPLLITAGAITALVLAWLAYRRILRELRG